MARGLCKVMGREGGGERIKRGEKREEKSCGEELSSITGWYHGNSRYDRENAI